MYKKIMAATGSLLVLAFLFIVFIYVPSGEVARAQEAGLENQDRLLERDKSVSKEKVDRAYAEAEKVMVDVQNTVKDRFRGWALLRSSISGSGGLGRKGQMHFETKWRTPEADISMTVTFLFSENEALLGHRRGAETISMGEFYPAPDFVGKEGILVKNVQFNKKSTQVGLHFPKGRAVIRTYITNYQRKTEKNEKDLLAFVKVIEPLIRAPGSFDDL